MAEKLQVLFAAFEASPFVKTGGLGDVAGSLPAALKNASCEVRVILPKFSKIPQEYRDQMEPVCTFQVPLGWRRLYCGIETLKLGKVQYYFVDNEYYFARDGVYGYDDDCERVAFFSKAILESLLHIPDFFPNVIHCNDYHTALLPVFLHEQYQGLASYRKIKTVFTIHNLRFQGICGEHALGDILGLHDCKNAKDQLHWGYDAINFIQGALYYTDAITTVSPTYAEEICTPEYGENLQDVLNYRKDRLSGILNGIDTGKFSPKKAAISFTKEDLSGKAQSKAALQEELGLPVDESKPLMVLISRLTDQKGLDQLAGALPQLMNMDLQIAILGTGDDYYERLLHGFSVGYPDKLAFRCTFDEPLSMRMYAGADFLLMPSQFEPCGLSQMIAMGYGTLPIVRETGGLKDSVIPYNKYTGEGTGFGFRNADAGELKDCIGSALELFGDKEALAALRVQAMEQDFSWRPSANAYRALYRKILKK